MLSSSYASNSFGRWLALPRQFFSVVAGCLAFVCLSGCGGGKDPVRVPVNGWVSLDGEPLRTGVIRFIPSGDNKGPAASATISEGFYEMSAEIGPVAGKQRVEIEATGHQGFDLDDEQAYARQAQSGTAIPKNPVPEVFNRQSRLLVEVPDEGKDALDFRLKSSGEVSGS